MADRSIVVRLRAEIGDLKAKLSEVEKAIDGVTDKQRETGEEATLASDKMAQSAMSGAEAYDAIAASLIGIGVASLAGLGMAVNAFMNFDEKMSAVEAATGEGAEGMDRLREAALQAGKDTSFSATEAADAVEQLAKAGVSTADILSGALKGSLDLAAAGQMDVGEAAEIAATAMTQFGLAGGDVTHIADLLAAGAGKAQGDVTDFGMALKQAGLVASQTGLTIEETTGGLAAFASAGLIGSDAGTSFKAMLQRLTPQSQEAERKMTELGISAYDAQGNFVGLSEFAGNLQESLRDLTPQQRNAAMAVIFGSDAVRAAGVLYEQGADGIARWTSEVDESGFAAEQARAKTDNLRGDLERLSGAWETAMIKTGASADGPLRGIVQRLDAMVSAYANMGKGAQTATLAVVGAVGVVSLLGGTAMLAIPKILAFEAALAGMGARGAAASARLVAMRSALMGPWGVALAAGTIALGAWANQQYESQQRVDALTDSLEAQTGALTDGTRALVVKRLEESGALAAADRMGVSLSNVTDALLGNKEAATDVAAALSEVEAKTGEGNVALGNYATSTGTLRGDLDLLNGIMGGTSDELSQAAEQHRLTAEAANQNAAATEGTTEATEAATVAIQAETEAAAELVQSLLEAGLIVLSTRDAQRSLEESVDAATAAIAENGTSMDITTKKGRANQAALDQVAKSAIQLAEAIYAETGSEVLMRESLAASRGSLIATARQFGYSQSEAESYADTVMGTPKSWATTFSTPGLNDAMAGVLRLKGYYASLDRSVTIRVDQVRGTTVAIPGGGRITERADGGIVQAFANGGVPRVPQVRAGGGAIVWNEPETGWEAYISGKPGMRDRNVGVWEDAGDRLGLNYMRFADGGTLGGPGSSAVSAGPVTAVLAAEDRALLREAATVINMPIQTQARPETFVEPLMYALRVARRGGVYGG